jgi:two-component system, cell cycle response regulator DivK
LREGNLNTVILVAEDDCRSMELIRDLLEVSGYSVIQAGNGAEAVEKAHHAKPALILMDMYMPVMDGFKATKILKNDESTKKIPIVAFTASVGNKDKDMVFEAGCDGFIAKPVDFKEALLTISRFFTKETGDIGNKGEDGS